MQFEDADEDVHVEAPAAPPVPVEHAAALQAPRPVAGPFLDEQESDSMPEDVDEHEIYNSEEDEWTGGDLESGLHAVMDQDWADAAGGEHLQAQTSPRASAAKLT